ncbi:MAG: hypothetical protein J0L92_12330 [Deltaproteobacteria bacterium]|nr:hypothetical protein [Deltaproteobacteria bacterium]
MTIRIAVLFLAGLVGLSACGRSADFEPAPRLARNPSTAERLSTIGIAQALMHETDVLEGMGDRAGAITRAERVLSLELSEDDPLREPLRLDAYGRVAELALADAEVLRAEVAIERGLAEVTERSYFEARLYMVRGRALEMRAATHRQEGDAALADAELRAALEAHEQSIEINEALLAGEEPTP